MKRLIIAALGLFAASSFTTDVQIQGQSLQVKERLAAIERINVTAKKEIDKSTAAELEAEVAAILEEAEEPTED